MSMSFVSLQAWAQHYDLELTKASPRAVVSAIEANTGYKVVCDKATLNSVEGTVTVRLRNLSLEQLLNRLLIGHMNLSYRIEGNRIVIIRRDASQPFFKSTVIGYVCDENNEPLVGASVRLVGTNIGTITDVDGNFTLIVEGHNPQLEVSFIGMKSKMIRFNPSETKLLTIQLNVDAMLMNEVVVTGYQNLKRENATGSYQTISSEDMERSHSGTIVSKLEGQIPGLTAYENGTRGSGEDALTIRGVGTFQAATKPLIVVDGLPIEGSIESVNPYDIANITVLKDASAAAIYGARASNGVIVITTKRASSDKVSIDFNTDITVSERNDYDNFGWASAAELVELERYNFNYMRDGNAPLSWESLLNYYQTQQWRNLSPVTRALLENHLGLMSDSDLESRLSTWSKNDYRKEWQNAMERRQVQQLYTLALRTQGKALSSNIVLSYNRDNLGTYKEHNNALTFKYAGELKAFSWLDLGFGVNLVSERNKTHISNGFAQITSFAPYFSMYDEDGSRARMQADVPLDLPTLSNPDYELKDASYNLLDERDWNFSKYRNTNIRSYVQALFKLLPGWTATAHFQYEDIYGKTDAIYNPDSYAMRYLYNLYTEEAYDMTGTSSIQHNMPEGGMRTISTSEGSYYTFRAQTQYSRTFQKHAIDVLGGFEFRESRIRTTGNTYIGYDDRTQRNANAMTNFYDLSQKMGYPSVMGMEYMMYGAPTEDSFATSETLHRFYSLYATGNYVYDGRYALSGSWRVDKTDLFGADPKYRGRPLWSVGASWNMHNEAFMKDVT